MAMKEHPVASSAPESTGSAPQGSDAVTVPSILEQLERILSSPAFVSAQRLSRFLRYAVDQFIQGHGDELKEYSLGVAVFDKEESFDPRTDPIVRVEAGRLRTKLREYYAEAGRSDTIIIDLPKGSYLPQVRKRCAAVREGSEAQNRPGPNLWRTAAIALALVLTVVAFLWLRQPGGQLRQDESAESRLLAPEFLPIWKPFLVPGSKNFVVFGSPIFFASPQLRIFIRAHQINDVANLSTDVQLQMLQQRLGPLGGPRYDYALMRDAIALQRLTAFLVRSGASLDAVAAHEAVWDSIKDGNIIFVGAPRMNPLMRHLPVQQDFEWDADQNVVNRKPSPGEQQIYTTPSHDDVLSYAVVASFPGLRADRQILVVASHGGPGSQAAVDYLTHTETLRVVNSKLQLTDKGERKYYQMLLRVFVDKGAPIKAEYITHHLIR